MGTLDAALQKHFSPVMARKALTLLDAIPKEARTWAEAQGKALARSPAGLNLPLLATEIQRRFVPAGSTPQNRQTIINGLTSAVLLAAIAGMPPPPAPGPSSYSAKADARSSSIDIETKKLERMIQKRSQLFEMLKGIMEKYDATAKGIIQSLGR